MRAQFREFLLSCLPQRLCKKCDRSAVRGVRTELASYEATKSGRFKEPFLDSRNTNSMIRTFYTVSKRLVVDAKQLNHSLE